MSEHETLEELAALAPVGGLEAADMARLEEHLASGCDRCQARFRQSQDIADALLHGVTAVDPPEDVKQRLMARIRSERRPRGEPPGRERSAAQPWWALAAAASLLAAAGLGLYAFGLRQRVNQESGRRREAEQRIAEIEENLDALAAPRTETVALTGQTPAPGARAKAFLDRESRRLFLFVYDLPPPPAGRTYQLWVIVGGTPASVGTFGVEPDGTARYDAQQIPSVIGAVTIAVTVEPLGGVPQPTGPMVLLGS